MKSLATATLILCVLGSTVLVHFGPHPVHASSSVNIVTNPSFEDGLNGWSFETCEGVANATATIDTSRWTDGSHSAKVFVGPVTNTFCTPYNATRTLGFTQFRQFYRNGMPFNNLTDSPNGFSFWFYLEPYTAGGTLGSFVIRVFGAEATAELDYVFNPDPTVGYPNYTDPNTHKEGVRSLLFYNYQPGQWYHFTRDLWSDWGILGFNMSRSFSLVQFQGLAIKNGQTLESETFWLDDVRIYAGPGPVPAETHSALFGFTDNNGNSVNSIVKWKLLNATGQEVAYELGQNTLPPGPYFVEAYYRSYNQTNRILVQQIHLDTSTSIALAIFPNSSVPNGYIVLDNPVTSVQVNQLYSTRFMVTVIGTTDTLYSMIMDVPNKPAVFQGNGVDLSEGSDWTYDTTLSVVRVHFIMPSGGENLTLFLDNPLRMPSLSFVDVGGSSLQNKITFRVVDSQGDLVPYIVGSVLPPGSFFVQASYESYLIYQRPIGTVGTGALMLEMLPLDASGNNYIALNSTASSISLSEYSKSKVAFSVGGPGPYLIVLNVPKKPLYVEKDGVRIASWVFNSTSQTVAVETETQGSFQLVLEENQPSTSTFPYLYIIGGAAVIAITVIGLALWRRQANISKEHTPEVPMGHAYQKQEFIVKHHR